MSDFESKKKNM